MGLFSKWVESLDYQFEVLSTCSRYVSHRSSCERCVASCNEKAISIQKGKPLIRHIKCTECGNCISACPVQSIAGIYPKRAFIQNQLIIKGKSKPSIKELLILHKKGIKVIVGETESSVESWKEQVEGSNQILLQLEQQPFSISIKSISEEESMSRRELFMLWKTKGKSVLKEVTPAKWRINQNDLDLPKYYPDFQFARITVDIEKCSLCKACEKLCTKNCFHINEDHFSIHPQRCTSCQLCTDTCPEKAITVVEEISKASEINLPSFKSTCSNCHKPFDTLIESDEKCIACKMQEKFNQMRK